MVDFHRLARQGHREVLGRDAVAAEVGLMNRKGTNQGSAHLLHEMS